MAYMKIMNGFHDAADRSFDPHGVVYTVIDIQGMFIDALARNEPPDSAIVKHCFDTPGNTVCSIIRNTKTKIDSLYKMDVESRTPCLVQKRKRPLFSRDFKQQRMERNWHNRYGDQDLD